LVTRLAGGSFLVVLVACQQHPGSDSDYGAVCQVAGDLPDSAGHSGAQAQADARHSAFQTTKTSEIRSRCHVVSAWLVPIAAATAKESRPNGSTKASGSTTGSAFHGLSSCGRNSLSAWPG
jgi:hypothetical protein